MSSPVREIVMDRIYCDCLLMSLLSGMPAMPLEDFDSLEGDVGVQTKICPNVSGFCPVVSGILSWCGRFLSQLGQVKRGEHSEPVLESQVKSLKKRRRFRCSCVSGAACSSAGSPASRASQMGSKIRFGRCGSSSVCSDNGGQKRALEMHENLWSRNCLAVKLLCRLWGDISRSIRIKCESNGSSCVRKASE
ncbi:hypothetical protein Pan110_14080 [Gimesia panareensis]|nr:hypothetical protein Pan110_14080 [Gimesia panareensis]